MDAFGIGSLVPTSMVVCEKTKKWFATPLDKVTNDPLLIAEFFSSRSLFDQLTCSSILMRCACVCVLHMGNLLSGSRLPTLQYEYRCNDTFGYWDRSLQLASADMGIHFHAETHMHFESAFCEWSDLKMPSKSTAQGA